MPKPEGQPRTPIDAELLAAFIDGRLEGERRREIIERLAEDEEAYELYDEVVRLREELAEQGLAEGPLDEPTKSSAEAHAPGEQPERGRLLPFLQRGGGVTRWLSVAAAIAIALLAGWWLLRPHVAAPPSVELLAAFDDATLTPAVAQRAPDHLGTVFRGPDGETQSRREQRALRFKLGVRSFDLALAAETGAVDETGRWLQETIDLLEQVDIIFGLPELYRDLTRRLEAGEPPARLRTEIAGAEAIVEEDLDVSPEPPLFAFSRWLEALRFAAAEGDRAFLASPAAHRPLRRFLSGDPSPEVAKQLGVLGAGLGPGAECADLNQLAAAADAIIQHCADGEPCLGVAEDE